MSTYLSIDQCRNITAQAYVGGLPICYRDGNVSPQFVQTVLDALSLLPEQLLQIIAERQFILILSGILSDVHPEQKYQKPRGHSQHGKGDDINGLCCASLRHIHLTEFTTRHKAMDTAETLRHELGHALDYSVGAYLGLGYRDVSLNYDFNQVHLADVTLMGSHAKQVLTYYIQNCSLAGRSEAFAEATASLFGGGCQDAEYFWRHFPNVVAWVESNILNVLGIPTRGDF